MNAVRDLFSRTFKIALTESLKRPKKKVRSCRSHSTEGSILLRYKLTSRLNAIYIFKMSKSGVWLKSTDFKIGMKIKRAKDIQGNFQEIEKS